MKKETQKRSKIIYILLSVLLALLAIGGVTAAFLLNYNTFAPDALAVLDDGQNIFISTTMNDNYKGYRFKFVDETEKTILIDSEKNQISVAEMLENKIELGKSYKVSVCYLAENVGNNSQYSKTITWKCQKYLEMPVAYYDEIYSQISWNEVENADFYRIYVNGEEEYFQTNDTFYNLKELKGGDKTIDIVAYSDDTKYLTSKSYSLQIHFVKYLESFTSIEFDEITNIITAKASLKYDKVKIYLNETSYEANLFEIVKNGNEYVYSIDITTIYNGEKEIGISPCTIDEFNIFNGEVTYYQGSVI